jgi:hypothetical protein
MEIDKYKKIPNMSSGFLVCSLPSAAYFSSS